MIDSSDFQIFTQFTLFVYVCLGKKIKNDLLLLPGGKIKKIVIFELLFPEAIFS